MGGRVVQKVVCLFDVLPMVPLIPRQPEQALLQNRVLAIPQRQRKAEILVLIAYPQQPVLTPPKCPRPRLIVRKRLPGGSVLRIVLPHRPPLPLGEVRPPLPPLLAEAEGVRGI